MYVLERYTFRLYLAAWPSIAVSKYGPSNTVMFAMTDDLTCTMPPAAHWHGAMEEMAHGPGRVCQLRGAAGARGRGGWKREAEGTGAASAGASQRGWAR